MSALESFIQRKKISNWQTTSIATLKITLTLVQFVRRVAYNLLVVFILLLIVTHTMSHNNKKIVKDVKNLDELLDLTDSEDTSSSSSDMQVFERNEAFVLELHELKRDELPDNPLPEVKTRKLLRKKKREQLPTTEHSGSSLPSSSVSESSVAPVGTDTKEEFYDAHESYHALPENQAQAAVTSTGGVVQVFSEHNAPKPPSQPPPTPASDDAKLSPAQPPPAPALATVTEPSTTTTKPVTPPE